jgi:RNA polymerase sigma factor (sigma-70 family)
MGKDKIGKRLLENKGALPDRAKADLEENVETYKLLIYKMAHKYVRNRVEYEDLIQEALLGLLLACRDYDPSRSEDFHT